MFLIPANSWLDVYRTTHQLVVYRCGAHTFHFHENPRSVFELSFGNSANTIWIANFVLFCGRLTFSVPWRRQNKNRATGRVQLHVSKKKIVFCFFLIWVSGPYGVRGGWGRKKQGRWLYTSKEKVCQHFGCEFFFLSLFFICNPVDTKNHSTGAHFHFTWKYPTIVHFARHTHTHTHTGAHYERWWRVLAVIN